MSDVGILYYIIRVVVVHYSEVTTRIIITVLDNDVQVSKLEDQTANEIFFIRL